MTDPVLCVIGTRPEAVKMAPVIRELRLRQVEHVVLSTGQHRELVASTLDSFGIDIDIDLDLMEPNQTPTQVAARVLLGIESTLREVGPSTMVVQGDTTTVMAAAIAGAYAGVQVTHLEAGLRTGDRRRPFPEELNRVIAGATADLHLAPTWAARANLLSEGVKETSVVVTGNTVIDALLWAVEVTRVAPTADILADLDATKRLVLMTAHRRESFGNGLVTIFETIRNLVQERGDIQVLFPVHPNPAVRAPAEAVLGSLDNVILCEPLDYFTMVQALDTAFLVLTDSGGLQEEAPALAKPVLVLRSKTERPEAVTSGVARLVGTSAVSIANSVNELLDDSTVYASMARGDSPYGDGHAAQRAVGAILNEPVPFFEPVGITHDLVG